MCSYSSDLYRSEERWEKRHQTGPTRTPGRRQECKEDESAMISKILHDKSHMIWGGTLAGWDPLGTKHKQPIHSFISSSACRLHAGFSAPSRKTTSWMRVVFFFKSMSGWSWKCSITSGMDRMSRVRKGGGSRGGNDNTGPYGEKGGWSNGRSVSALHRVRQNKNTL